MCLYGFVNVSGEGNAHLADLGEGGGMLRVFVKYQ